MNPSFVSAETAGPPARPEPLRRGEGPRIPATVVSVYDGDTITVDAHPWPGITIRTAVRLAGIDTPEIRGRCAREKALAMEARAFVRSLVADAGGRVTLSRVAYGKYAGRVLAAVTLGGRDLAATVAAAGLARAYDGGPRGGWCP